MNLSNEIFTGIKDVDFKLLLEYDDKQLGLICQIDKYASSLFNDNYFWKLKINKLFTEIPIPENYKDNIKQLYIIISFFVEDLTQLMIWGIKNKYLKVLEWLANKYNILPDEDDANGAAMDGYLEILKWLTKYNIFPDEYGANYAAHNGHLEILKYLAKYDILPDNYGADSAAEEGHLEVLKWLSEYDIFPNTYIANEASCKGQLEILKWLSEHNIFPNIHGANFAAINGHLEVLKWLAKHNILPYNA